MVRILPKQKQVSPWDSVRFDLVGSGESYGCRQFTYQRNDHPELCGQAVDLLVGPA